MVSWLPLYHDMGLVGFCMLPMAAGIDLVLGAPQDFMAKSAAMDGVDLRSSAARPQRAPTSRGCLLTRALRRAPKLDLSSLRIALNGAEPVDPASVQTR